MFEATTDFHYMRKVLYHLFSEYSNELGTLQKMFDEYHQTRDVFLLPKIQLASDKFLSTVRTSVGSSASPEAGLLLMLFQVLPFINDLDKGVTTDAKKQAC